MSITGAVRSGLKEEFNLVFDKPLSPRMVQKIVSHC
jgi:hypothetical protein